MSSPPSFKLTVLSQPPPKPRSIEDVWKIINSNEMLRRIPTRISPDAVFSEDEEESDGALKDGTRELSLDFSSTPERDSLPRDVESNACYEPKFRVPSHEAAKSKSIPRYHSLEMFKKEKSEESGKSLFNELYLDTLAKIAQSKKKKSLEPSAACLPGGSSKTCPKPNIVMQGKSKVVKNVQTEYKAGLPRNPADSSMCNNITVNGTAYEIISVLGSGGSCKVYSAMEKLAKHIVAIKHVNLGKADEVLKNSFVKEIEYLKMFRSSDYVIQMLDYELRQGEILIVLEKGDIDLAHFLSDERRKENLTPITMRYLWYQMLKAVEEIHAHGIIHSDLKPANFLFVSGHLKLIDFGIATSVPNDMTSVLRDSHVGTVNYMSPETLHCYKDVDKTYKVSVKSDLWSLGCILYDMAYGSTPFASLRQVWSKIQAIVSPQYAIPFPPLENQHLIDVLKKCLVRNPRERASVAELLQHPYLNKECNAKSVNSPEGDVKNIVAQLELLTPRRRSVVSGIIGKLAQEKKQH